MRIRLMLRTWRARRAFKRACDDFIYWQREVDLCWEALGEEGPRWQDAEIERVRAQWAMDYYGKLAWPSDRDVIKAFCERND